MAEATPLLTAHLKCRDLWSALQVADYKHEGRLNDAAVSVLFDRESEKFQELLLVQNSEELLQLLDENEDGVINEDEQLLMFSLVKERMQQIADALSLSHEYILYKDMMKSIRLLEADITTYQETLRKRTYDKELSAYRELGEEKISRFQADWKRRFAQFREDHDRSSGELREKQNREWEALEETMRKERESTKVKVRARVKNLAEEEKLVAIFERYNEAGKIRTELRVMEQEEISHFDAEITHDSEKRRAKLTETHEKEKKQLQTRTQKVYYRLKIKMKQQYSRLLKEVKLYINDITKNQNLGQRLARKLGETRDELRRTKKKAKEMMELMSEAKSIPKTRQAVLSVAPSLPRLTSRQTLSSPNTSLNSLPSLRTLTSPLQASRKHVTKFGISSEFLSADKPVNSASAAMLKPISTKDKLAAQLISKHKARTQLQSLAGLYSDMLTLVEKEERDTE